MVAPPPPVRPAQELAFLFSGSGRGRRRSGDEGDWRGRDPLDRRGASGGLDAGGSADEEENEP